MVKTLKVDKTCGCEPTRFDLGNQTHEKGLNNKLKELREMARRKNVHVQKGYKYTGPPIDPNPAYLNQN
jgi:hypothetical protein